MSSSSSSSATVRVDKATSDLLLGPDWTMNIDICDSINSNHWQAKEVVKALKKRLLHKNPKVQLLALTLLETMIKNCGEYVHSQIAERNILHEMIKIVRKKMDMQVRDKILDLLDSWQEAFGGPGGKYPQYYWAYEELRRSGVEFPQRSCDAAPIFTPPVTNSLMRPAQTGYGMPSNTSLRLDEAMASETENISLSNLDAMRSVTELLSDMLQAVNPNDREAVKDEIIVDLVSQCRSNQKKLMQTLSSTVNEELLARGLELNDSLQSLLVMHDAVASGSPLPSQVRDPIPTSTRDDLSPTSPFPIAVSQQLEDEEEDENDDFAQLARRRTKSQVTPSESSTSSVSVETGPSPVISTATSGPHNALALPDPPNPVKTSSKEQDMIDLLSITLSTSSISPNTPPSTTSQTTPASPATQGYPYGSQPFPGYQPQAAPVNNYVAPWAQPQMQQQQPMQQQQQPLSPPPPQQQPQYPQYSYNYPLPPWATSPVNMNQTPTYYQPPRPMQNYNSFPVRGTNTNVQPANGVKTFVPSYRLFEDLNVLGNSDTTTTSTTSMTGQSMVGGRK